MVSDLNVEVTLLGVTRPRGCLGIVHVRVGGLTRSVYPKRRHGVGVDEVAVELHTMRGFAQQGPPRFQRRQHKLSEEVEGPPKLH